VAWERVRELSVTIDEQRDELTSLAAELRRSAKSLDQERAQVAWINSHNDRLQADLAEAKRERDLLRERFEELRRTALPDPQRRAQRPDSAQPNRAQRRAADRRGGGKA
jgi:predicted RNase H-like nuclease (RuvC/YqgF family)